MNDKLHALKTLSFIHSKLLQTRFYPEEFIDADAGLRLLATMAQQIDADLLKAKESASDDSAKINVAETGQNSLDATLEPSEAKEAING